MSLPSTFLLDVRMTVKSFGVFNSISSEEFKNKTKLNSLEGHIYNTIYKELESESVQKQILNNFPKPEIHRRNTGYAIDELIHSDVFTETKELFISIGSTPNCSLIIS